jgi:hypothetical protein
MLDKDDIIKIQQKCINRIDDFLEYRYLNYRPDQIKIVIMAYIDEMTTTLKQEVDKAKKG